jgi:RNA polymerase-binding transcription factor DksA
VAVEEYRALLRAAEATLDGVDRALAALDDGTYGACEVCGAAVDGWELERDPLVTRCSSHRVAGAG